MKFHTLVFLFGLVVFLNGRLIAGEPLPDEEEATEPEKLAIVKVDGNEKPIQKYSFSKAVQFLDQTSMAWTKRHKCFTCHTNYAHLIAASELNVKPKYFEAVKTSLDELVKDRWKTKGPRWDAEVLMTATTLALLDRNTTGKLSSTTKDALDRIWEVQRDDGGFDWLKCNWPPMESDDEYGIAITAVGLSATPQSYRDQESVQMGIKKLKGFIGNSGLKRLHHQAMLIWAESLGGDWLKEGETQEIVDQIRKLQNDDGGWNTAAIGKWKRDDGKPADMKTSDGYATGFSIFILRKAEVPASDPAIQKGLKWLKQNQRESGRWYTRSVSRDNKHYLTHAGTAMAIMALNSCKSNAQ